MRAGRWSYCTVILVAFSMLVGVSWISPDSVAYAQLIWPGERMATIDGKHLRAHVPAEHAERLRSVVARADQIYGHMLEDARYEPDKKLTLLLADWTDQHNGYSFVTPFPVVQVELAPALTASSIFHGGDGFERTLVHELAHHISNDRTHGFRRGLETVFGRVIPSDLISLILAYLSTPAHQTMPSFWHEGLAVWAETAYATADSAWGGRGRDPLTQMIWRLDAAADQIPPVADWRLSHHEWPYGRIVYTYGAAYLRYLAGRLPDELGMWQVIEGQSRSWPYFFSRGSRRTLGFSHSSLIRQARLALAREQKQNLDSLRSRPTTKIDRLTPPELFVGAPAWLPNGDLFFAVNDLHDRARMYRLSSDGELTKTSDGGHSLGNVRSRGALVTYHEYNWRRFAHVRVNGQKYGHRLLQPDVVETSKGVQIAAIELPGGGEQRLIVRSGNLTPTVIPTEGIPWSPTFRSLGMLAWVETDDRGSSLIVGNVGGDERRTVVEVAGRILHPVWSRNGEYIYFCADHSGVANAYRVSAAGGSPQPITNTIGGVIACVPSPDGKMLAVVEHDHDGPYIGKIANDPAKWIEEVPELSPTWPAPPGVESDAQLRPGRRVVTGWPAERPLPETAPSDAPEARPYRGIREFRPLFWSPTTAPAPGGGFGVSGLASDALFTHVLAAGVGGGPIDGGLVGFVGYAYTGWPIHFGAAAWQGERSLNDELIDIGGGDFDYEETISNIEVRAGRGLAGLEKRVFAYGSIGVQEYDPLDDTEDLLATITPVSTPAIDGTEEYVGFTIGYGDTTFFPTSYAPEDGVQASLEYRHSGFGGELDRNRAFFNGSMVCSLSRDYGQQLVVGVQTGWSDGERSLQNNFAIGGNLNRGLPRGYAADTEAVGRHLFAGSLALRTPLWRPFAGLSTTPFRLRQVVLEVFGDTGNVDDGDIAGNSQWYTSVGAEIYIGIEIDRIILQPGVGVAQQLDGDRDTEAYIQFGLAF